MFKYYAVRLLAVAMMLPASATEPVSSLPDGIMGGRLCNSDDVRDRAASNSIAANLVDSEELAISASADRNDRRSCLQDAVSRSVNRKLACHERERSAAQALVLYFQLLGLLKQRELLEQATLIAERLLQMAKKADELELKDGDVFELDKQRLSLLDQQEEADLGILKLRLSLAELVDNPCTEDCLFVTSEGPIAQGFDGDYAAALTTAYASRCDLQALDTLCRSLNEDTLPIVRQLLGSLQPGLGLSLLLATRKPLLALHSDDRSDAELCQRRKQCQQLRQTRQGQIETQVRIAIAERDSSLARLTIAEQRSHIDSEIVNQRKKAIELDQAIAGADLIAELEHLRARGRVIERETAVAVAKVRLQEAIGTVLDEPSSP